MISPVKIWRESQKQYQYLGKQGKIVSFTQIQTPLSGFGKNTPYLVAVIAVDKGRKITSQLVDSVSLNQGRNSQEPVLMGRQVVGVLRRLKTPDNQGVIEYGVKFKLTDKS